MRLHETHVPSRLRTIIPFDRAHGQPDNARFAKRRELPGICGHSRGPVSRESRGLRTRARPAPHGIGFCMDPLGRPAGAPPMLRTSVIAVVPLLAALRIIRERLDDRSLVGLRGVPNDIDRGARHRFSLPPKRFRAWAPPDRHAEGRRPSAPAVQPARDRRLPSISSAAEARARGDPRRYRGIHLAGRVLARRAHRAPAGPSVHRGSHQDSYRDFLARRFFASYPVDVLYLEAGGLIPWLELKSDRGERGVDLLPTDIAKVIRAAIGRNSEVDTHGAEETASQRRTRRAADTGARGPHLPSRCCTSGRCARAQACAPESGGMVMG